MSAFVRTCPHFSVRRTPVLPVHPRPEERERAVGKGIVREHVVGRLCNPPGRSYLDIQLV